MINPSIDDLLKVVDDRYSLVITASKRARQIVESEAYAEMAHRDKPVSVAVREIIDGKVKRVENE